MAEIKRLMTRSDVIQDIDNNITPIYFPSEMLDKNRIGTYGWFVETQASAIEDSIMLEQTRAADYCPELSNNEIHINQTAKIRGVSVKRATPGTCFAVLGILKSDIITKGVRYSDLERRFVIDRRSRILYGQIPFSLEDDILIRAILRDNKYYFTANYTMEHASSTIMDQYLQVYEYTSTQGEEILGMVVKLQQCSYNISDQTVIDNVEFIYDGLYYEYANKMAGFEVYYKASPTEPEYTQAKLDHYLTTASALNKCLYYNDDESNMLKIMNNPYLGLTTNSIVRVEIRETLGADGNVTLNGVDTATFTMYQDAAYNYSGVYVYINMLTDTTGGVDGDSLTEIKQSLITAKTRRSNVTTEHDIITYINDVDSNIQLVKKRNDTQDRNYYMYTLMRTPDRTIAPATTKPLILNGPVSPTDPGDFDVYNAEVRRKLLRANNRFRLNIVSDGQDSDYVTKVPLNTPEVLIVDPTEMPDIETEGYELGTIIRVRHTVADTYTDRTYTVAKHSVGYATGNVMMHATDDPTSAGLIAVPARAKVVVDETESVDDYYHVSYGHYSGYVPKTSIDYTGEEECYYQQSYYLTCPYMMVIDELDIAAYYFNSVSSEAILSMQSSNSFYPLQMISRAVRIFRDAHAPRTYTDGVDVVEGKWGFFPPIDDSTVELLDSRDSFPETGEDDKLYIAADTGFSWIWNGTAYVNRYYVDVDTNLTYSYDGSDYVRQDETVVVTAPNIYTFTVVGTMNTENDELLVDSEYNVIDDEAVMCYLFFTLDGTLTAYLPMKISGYNSETREFTFTGNITTSDYITELEKLEITSGLYQVGGDADGSKLEYNSVIDYKGAAFTVDFLYKEGENYEAYRTTDQIFTLLTSTELEGYVLMNAYYNNPNNLYDLILEFGKFTRSPVVITNTGGASQNVRCFGPVMETDETIQTAIDAIRSAESDDEAVVNLVNAFGFDNASAKYVLNNRMRILQNNMVRLVREAWAEYKEHASSSSTQYTIKSVPFFEFHFGVDNTASLFPTFKNMVETYSALLKLTTDFEVALKFIATYGTSKYITVTGGRDSEGAEVVEDLADLNPTLYFKVYGFGAPIDDIYKFIYEYLRDHYITDDKIFMSNICTAVEDTFPSVTSIKFMGIDDFDASYQQVTFTQPDFLNTDVVMRFVPEQLNVSDIRIELVEF